MIGACQLRPGSVATGTAAATATITGAYALTPLQDSFILFVVGGTASGARTVNTPPASLAQIYAATNTNGASVGHHFSYGSPVNAGIAAPSLVLSTTLANAEWLIAEYLNVDVDNPLNGVPPALNWITAAGGQTALAGALAAVRPSGLAVGILAGRGAPTTFTGALDTPTVDHAPAGSSCAAALVHGSPAPGAVSAECAWTANGTASPSLGMGGIILAPQAARGWGIVG